MTPRPVIPKNLENYPDFPQKQPGQSQDDYDSVIIAYWAEKRREKRKLEKQEQKLRKLWNKLEKETDKHRELRNQYPTTHLHLLKKFNKLEYFPF